VIIGLRPEHLLDAALTERKGDGGVTFTGEVDVLEAMGAEYYAYFDLPDQSAGSDVTEVAAEEALEGDPVARRRGGQLIARLPIDSDVRECKPLTLWFDPARLHVFDPENGQRLTEVT
jgi:multiple sugar transport system ATP-binding protein